MTRLPPRATSWRAERRVGFLLGAMLLSACSQAALGQEDGGPDAPPPPPSPQPAHRDGDETRPRRWLTSLFSPRPGETDEQFRARLHDFVQRQLEFSKHRQERLEKLSKLLEQGASPADIRASFEEMMPFLNGGGWGGRDDDQRGPAGKATDRFEDLESLRPLPPDEPPMHRQPGEKPAPLTTDQQAFVNDFLQATAPDLLRRLKELATRDPSDMPRRYERIFGRMRWLKDLRDRDPEVYDLRLEDIRLAREAIEAARKVAKADLDKKPADDPDRVKQLGVLRESLKAQYQVRSKLLKHEIDKWQGRLAQVQTDLQQRDQKQDEVVNQFADGLVKHERDRMEHHNDGPPGPHDGHGPPRDGSQR